MTIAETAHTLGMDEVYYDPGHDVSGATHCVMEMFDGETGPGFYQNVLTNGKEPFCSSCNQAMTRHTSNISISGNQ